MKRVLSGSLTAPLLLSIGCSTSTGGSTPPNSSGNHSSVGSTSSVGGSNTSKGGGSFHYDTSAGGSTTMSTTGPLNPDAGCAADVNPAQLTRVNILVLLDKSGSMGEQKKADGSGYDFQNCEDRWNPVSETLKAFFGDPNSGRLWASLSFLPADGDEYSMCTVTNYTKGSTSIKVPLTALDDAGRAKFTNKLCDCGTGTTQGSSCIVPAGGTPTLAAVQGTIQYADSVRAANLAANEDAKTVIVFLTDGEPGFGFTYNGDVKHLYSCDDLPPKGCTGAACGCVEDDSKCTTPDEEVAKVAAVIQGAPSKSIYVAGVGDLSSATLQSWADASGNEAIDLLGKTGAEAATIFRARLEAIRQSSIACDFAVPAPKNGSSIDPDKTNVAYTSGTNQTSNLSRTKDGTAATCGTATNSWYFDNPRDPKKITLCQETCAALQPDPNGKVQVVYGCETIVQIY